MKRNILVNKILVVLVIILASSLLFETYNKKPSSTGQVEPANSQNTQKIKNTVPKEYVKKTDDSANKATFVFVVPVKKQDIIGANIRYCIVSASAGAQAEGREEECKETILSNSFSLQYNEATRALIISDPTPGEWGPDGGPFRIGCAACFSVIEFNGIHTSDGQLLPKAVVTVY
ncbi:MAG TPA: hypothetical protein VK675_03865 [Candidatus Paceibacterota bacterium]|nr:hypothetical protein [Candidatus Paceibacterota bacterium]